GDTSLDAATRNQPIGNDVNGKRDVISLQAWHYSSYLRSEPRNFSGGYFAAFAAIFLSATVSRSIPALSANRITYSRMSASSSWIFGRMEGSMTSSQLFCPLDHWNNSSSSAASTDMDVARFFGVWNWSQSRSAAKDLKVAASFSLSITDAPMERLRMQARQRAARNLGIKRGAPSATLRCGCADWREALT